MLGKAGLAPCWMEPTALQSRRLLFCQGPSTKKRAMVDRGWAGGQWAWKGQGGDVGIDRRRSPPSWATTITVALRARSIFGGPALAAPPQVPPAPPWQPHNLDLLARGRIESDHAHRCAPAYWRAWSTARERATERGGHRIGARNATEGRAKTHDVGVYLDHGAGHLVPGGIGVEATVDLFVLLEEGFEPEGIGPGAGGGNAEGVIVQGSAAHRIDSGFAEDDVVNALLMSLVDRQPQCKT
jgi:hypothetical protein